MSDLHSSSRPPRVRKSENYIMEGMLNIIVLIKNIVSTYSDFSTKMEITDSGRPQELTDFCHVVGFFCIPKKKNVTFLIFFFRNATLSVRRHDKSQ